MVTAFGARVISGALRPDGAEISACRYFSEEECRDLPLSAWLESLLPMVFATRLGSVFQPASWAPPRDGG